jgi:hypothetical protein
MRKADEDIDLPLNCDRDAARWAREFIQEFKAHPVGGIVVDEGLMIAWFANAMMCGEDTYRWRTESTKAVANKPLNESTQRTLDAIESLLVGESVSVKDALAAAYRLGQLDGMIEMSKVHEKQIAGIAEMAKAGL